MKQLSPILTIALLSLVASTVDARPAGRLMETMREGVENGARVGRPFRVRFDPASVVRLGMGCTAGPEGDSWMAWSEVTFGLGYRVAIRIDDELETVSWQYDHWFLHGWIRPWTESSFSIPQLDATLYRGSYLRHSSEPHVTFAGERLPFPFDIGVDVTVGRTSVPPLQTSGAGDLDLLHIDIAQGVVFLDPWRTGRSGNSVEIGLGIRYGIDLIDSEEQEVEVIHHLAPLMGTFRFRYQDDPGLTVLDLQISGDLVPHWSSDDTWNWRFEALARFERVLIAVNDEPLAVVLEAAYQYRPPIRSSSDQHEAKLMFGLSWGFQLQ